MLGCPCASHSPRCTLGYAAESVMHLLVNHFVPGLITECARYKAIVQLGFAWHLIARLSVVMYSRHGVTSSSQALAKHLDWNSSLHVKLHKRTECKSVYPWGHVSEIQSTKETYRVTLCWASLFDCLRSRHKGSAAVRISSVQ